LATKKRAQATGEPLEDKGIHLLHEHIREQFVHNARIIAENEKPERLLKMIETCPKLKPVTRANKELWEIVQKVRQEVLGIRKTMDRKTAGKRTGKAGS